MANALQVGAVDTIGDALVFLGKLSVMAGAGKRAHPVHLACGAPALIPCNRSLVQASSEESSYQDTFHAGHACMSCKHCQHHALAASAAPHGVGCPHRHFKGHAPRMSCGQICTTQG